MSKQSHKNHKNHHQAESDTVDHPKPFALDAEQLVHQLDNQGHRADKLDADGEKIKADVIQHLKKPGFNYDENCY